MTYTPSESEKTCATIVQAASAVFFFLPALLIRWTAWGRSPYIRFWAKANFIWSTMLLVIIVVLAAAGMAIHSFAPCIAAWAAHLLMVIMASFAAMFNRPFGYFLITERYCLKEMSRVYGAATSAIEEAEAH
jgi:hypothetical protein